MQALPGRAHLFLTFPEDPLHTEHAPLWIFQIDHLLSLGPQSKHRLKDSLKLRCRWSAVIVCI